MKNKHQVHFKNELILYWKVLLLVFIYGERFLDYSFIMVDQQPETDAMQHNEEHNEKCMCKISGSCDILMETISQKKERSLKKILTHLTFIFPFIINC